MVGLEISLKGLENCIEELGFILKAIVHHWRVLRMAVLIRFALYKGNCGQFTFYRGGTETFSQSVPKEQASTTPIPVAPSPHLLHRQTFTLIPQTPYHSHCHSPCKSHSMYAISSENVSTHPMQSVYHQDAFHSLTCFYLRVGRWGSWICLVFHCCFQITLCHTHLKLLLH